jgi:hypothetical protein
VDAWNVDYTTRAGHGPSLFAVIALWGSLGLGAVLGVGGYFYRTRLANRLPRNPFPRR